LTVDQLLTVAAEVRRRRAVVVTILMLAAGSGPQGPKRLKAPFNWEDHANSLSDKEFSRRYRLTKKSFRKLLFMLRPQLEPATVMARRNQLNGNCGSPVHPATVLAIGLRFLAGDQALDLKVCYRLSETAIYKCVCAVVDAVDEAGRQGGWVGEWVKRGGVLTY